MDEIHPPATRATWSMRMFARPYLLAALLLVIGAGLAIGGTKLVLLGGSPYYVLAGLAVIASAVFVALGRRTGAQVYALMLAGTIVWSLWESGLDGWALAARLAAPMTLGLWFLMPWTRSRLGGSTWPWSTWIGVASVAVVLGGALHAGLAVEPIDPLYQAGTEPALSVAPPSVGGAASADWPAYGNDDGGSRFRVLGKEKPLRLQSDTGFSLRLGRYPISSEKVRPPKA